MPVLQFKGKSFVENHHLTVRYHQLVPDLNSSLTETVSLQDNLVLHGDNLIALKALLPQMRGQVQCVYIDPPYNTGQENWVYSDNVSSPMIQEWLQQNNPVDREDLTRHDKWLCMMMPRLILLRELISEDGIILVSINDVEIHHLRMLMEEIFGESNFIATIVWQKSRKGSSTLIANIHEYILVFAKNKELVEQKGKWRKEKDGVQDVLDHYEKLKKELKGNHEKISQAMKDWYKDLMDDDPRKRHQHYRWSDDRGLYFAADFAGPDDGRDSRPRYDIFHPVTGKPCKKPSTGWRWDEERTKKALKAKPRLIHFGDDETTIPCRKTYLFNTTGEPLSSVFYRDGRAATVELEQIVGPGRMDFPKNADVLRELFSLMTDDDSTILDSFAGSGTTAQAVLQLNKETGSLRRFVLVEMEDYATDLTAERVRRVIQGVDRSPNESLREGLGGSFSFFTVGEPIDESQMLSGKNLPSYQDFARYLFYTSTGEEFDPQKLTEENYFVGESSQFYVYLLYKPDLEFLRSAALTIEHIEALPDDGRKTRLIFAPSRYVDRAHLQQHNIKFVMLPFEIYQLQSKGS